MIYPKKTKYISDSKTFNLIPVSREVRADFETPVSIFMKVKANILLESVEQGENVGRFSIIAVGKRMEIRLNGRGLDITEFQGDKVTACEHFELDNPLEKVRDYFNRFNVPHYDGLPPFFGGALGYLGYETLRYFEDIPVKTNGPDDPVPDGLMIIPEVVLVYDSVKRSVFVIALTSPGQEPEPRYREAVNRIETICAALSQPSPLNGKEITNERKEAAIRYGTEKTKFLEAVETCKDYIVNGDIIQVVISQAFEVATTVPAFELYRTLRVLNPSPYLFFLDFDDFCLIGSSPEVMVRVRDGEILLKPIAGTRKRGGSVADDAAISDELLADQKERAEHLMLVDLGRNDLGRVAAPGTVRVTDFMKVEKFSHVMHIVSTIKCEPDEQVDVFDVIRACFPAGTLTGAPKIRAMEIIEELEPVKRGPYGGMIFNLGFNGNMDSCITIRTMVLKNGTAYVQAGAGIVADSVPEREYEETINKARVLIDTIELTGGEGAA
jgi:anthranilate synthase component 1